MLSGTYNWKSSRGSAVSASDAMLEMLVLVTSDFNSESWYITGNTYPQTVKQEVQDALLQPSNFELDLG